MLGAEELVGHLYQGLGGIGSSLLGQLGPSTAMFMRYLRIFLIIVYGGAGGRPQFPSEELEAFVTAGTEPSIPALSELFCAGQRDLRNVARGAGPAIAGVPRFPSDTLDLSLDAGALRRVLKAEKRALKQGRRTPWRTSTRSPQ